MAPLVEEEATNDVVEEVVNAVEEAGGGGLQILRRHRTPRLVVPRQPTKMCGSYVIFFAHVHVSRLDLLKICFCP